MTIPTAICLVVGVISTFLIRDLSKIERVILIVVYLNIVADVLSDFILNYTDDNGHVYNVLAPIEKILTVYIYLTISTKSINKTINKIGIVILISMSILGYFIDFSPNDFHFEVFVLSGLLISILSYLFLRQLATGEKEFSIVIFFFGMANLIYYTLMVSSVSALPISDIISDQFANLMFLGNEIAYSLWSLTILTGILWKRMTKT